MNPKLNCEHCGKPLEGLRKRFCSTDCRNKHHNKLKKLNRNFVWGFDERISKREKPSGL